MSVFGYNLKKLRNLYGETQSELANTLHITQHAISQYETGRHIPDFELLQMISDHYNVSVDSFLQKKLSFPDNVLSCELPSNIDTAKYYQTMFPIIKTDTAMENIDFAAAIDQHVLLRKSFFEENADDIVPISVFERYYEAAKEGVLEAQANMISLVLMTYQINISAHVADNLDEKNLDVAQIANKHFDLMLAPNLLENREEFLHIVKEYFYDYLRNMKRSGKLSELADYYVWLLYRYSLFEEDIPANESAAISDHLYSLAICLKNKYALRLLKETLPYINDQ